VEAWLEPYVKVVVCLYDDRALKVFERILKELVEPASKS
jgi:hypothetical protein